MSVVIPPLQDCIARPDTANQRFPLIEHLIAVAKGCGRPDGTPVERLGYLAGLAHDAAKAAAEWQQYIRNPRIPKGPPHAPLGSALFSFWADDLIPQWTKDNRAELGKLLDLALDWTRLVYDHHQKLHDLPVEVAPWTEGTGAGDLPALLEQCDCSGLTNLVKRFFPELKADLSNFRTWLSGSDTCWHRRRRRERSNLINACKRERQGEAVPLALEGMRLPRLGAQLIFADRSHAADWDVSTLPPAEAGEAARTLERHCQEEAEKSHREGADPALVRARQTTQTRALDLYTRQDNALAYTLLLPTGYGKTLNGLRVALEACRRGRCERIIYVAPYLSILSQAANEIRTATGLEVFVHHHLTSATLEDHQPYDVLDTWQAPVLATTFNQLFRALFPKRAQQCLRIRALSRAFLFIDEPQIIDITVWNLFLRALAVVGRERQCTVLFSTATLPPLEDGLGAPAVSLTSGPVVGTGRNRYTIHARSLPWGPAEVADEARSRLTTMNSVVAILNTVRDAVRVYQLAQEKNKEAWRFLAAMMLPGHKARQIAEIRDRLQPKSKGEPIPTGVVCTQILEAGVNLSFRSLLRAIPIFSSIAQAAGRANRHGEGEDTAEVIVFPFRREDGTDSRPFVYRDGTALRHTDTLVTEYPELQEQDLVDVLTAYYERCRRENPATACLQQFEKAAGGEWSALAGLRPFEDRVPEMEVFIPDAEHYLAEGMQPLMDRLAPGGSRELLKRYTDPSFRRSLKTFRERKQLSALIHQFTVSVPKKMVHGIASPCPNHDWLWELSDPNVYSDETGLAHLLGPEGDEPSCQIV
jgi:CRISPR-associated endonuclease/helicase Cas3